MNQAPIPPDFVAHSNARPQLLIGMLLGRIIMVGLEFGGPENMVPMCEKSRFIDRHR